MTPYSACTFMLLILGLHFSAGTAVNQLFPRSSASRQEISSPLRTNWGTWTPNQFCPALHFVTGMQLRTEPDKDHRGDNTALNAIRFICSAYGTSQLVTTLTPHEGFWGNWGAVYTCGGSDVAVGFELRSEEYEGRFDDDTAANNLRLICSSSSGGRVLQGDGLHSGKWTGQQRCPRNWAICGLRVQVEARQQGGDDTALNNLVASCCELPSSSNDA